TNLSCEKLYVFHFSITFKKTDHIMRKLRSLSWLSLLLLFSIVMKAQQTFPVNGVADPRESYFAFTNATIVKDGQTTLKNATLIIRKGKIVSVGTNLTVPKEAVVINCS